MPNEEKLELARRAVACKGWKWLPGMHGVHERDHVGFYLGPMTVLSVDAEHVSSGGIGCASVHEPSFGVVHPYADEQIAADLKALLPDLDDPATQGCLLALVRDLYADCRSSAEWQRVKITIYNPNALAKALVAALEAAQA